MPMTDGQQHRAARAHRRRPAQDHRRRHRKGPRRQTPQLWALYKEVQDYYDKGMRVPDDVTLLFSDDNWGNIRRLPTRRRTRKRSGGFGVYYHFDYVGGPRNYKWINTNPIARVWEQMHLAYEYGANRIWIVNVGDLKPMEFPISVLPRLRVESRSDCPPSDCRNTRAAGRAQQFGAEHASEIADIIDDATSSTPAAASPSCSTPPPTASTNYREAERVVDDVRHAARASAERLGERAAAAVPATRSTSSCCTR